jgi:hypothetical protein
MMTPGPAEYMFQRDCKHKMNPPVGTVAVEDIETALLSGAMATGPLPEAMLMPRLAPR